VASVASWVLLETLVPGADIARTPAMLDATRRMEGALAVVAEHCRESGIAVSEFADPNGTCLIGPEMSELFTTAGQLEAKRTTTNPVMAGLVVHLLEEAGVSAGDTVAVAASGSFPALMVATFVAVESLAAVPVAILSPGASSWGATRPDFDLLDLHALLLGRGVIRTPVGAASLGGSHDVGREFEPEVRERLARKIQRRGIRFINEPDLAANVAERMRIYGRAVAFVNIGGSDAALGTSPAVLDVPAGLNPDLASRVALPPAEQRGVIFAMAAEGVPVVHLLHVRGLALRFGVPWDPVPLPGAERARLRQPRGRGAVFWLITLAWLGGLFAVASVNRDAGRDRRPRSRLASIR
jgi:poly-gamma-glutamate system protein